jgi:glycosyltransferase involved in cell wall biosynthesis
VKGNPLISVIIPAYNEGKNIGQCLQSMIEQSYSKKEIIVIDDGSTDGTIKKIQDTRYKNIEILEQKHGGPGRARNLAAKKAKGEILVFMDADMTFDKNFLKELTEPIIKGVFKGTFSKNEYISNWENIWSRCWNFNQNWPSKKMIPDDYPDEGQDFRAILKTEFDRVSGFDDVGYTDTWSLSRKLGYKPHSVLGATYYHSNPDNLREVFLQSRWVAKRVYKLGFLGKLIALVRVSVFVSLLSGIYKSIKYKEPGFLIFKIVYDLGSFLGILEMMFFGKLSK